MILINLNNVEDVIFKSLEAKQLLPEFKQIFDQWFLSYRSPAFADMRKYSLLQLLNSLDSNHIEKLSKLLKDAVTVEKFDTQIVKNLSFPIDDSIEQELTNYINYNNMALSRNATHTYITLWR